MRSPSSSDSSNRSSSHNYWRAVLYRNSPELGSTPLTRLCWVIDHRGLSVCNKKPSWGLPWGPAQIWSWLVQVQSAAVILADNLFNIFWALPSFFHSTTTTVISNWLFGCILTFVYSLQYIDKIKRLHKSENRRTNFFLETNCNLGFIINQYNLKIKTDNDKLQRRNRHTEV